MVLARKVGATVKPEAAVLSPTGELLYRGRINDIYADFGKRRAQRTHCELKDILEAILAGKPVAVLRRRPSAATSTCPAPRSKTITS